MTDDKPGNATSFEISLLPLRDIVVFPHMVVPLVVGRERSVAAVEHAMANDKRLLLASQKKARLSAPSEEDINTRGTLAEVVQLRKLPDGTVKVLVEGRARGDIQRFLQSDPFYLCAMVTSDVPERTSVDGESAMQKTLELFERYVELNRRLPREVQQSVKEVYTPPRLSDAIAGHLKLSGAEKQSLLEEDDPLARLELLQEMLEREVEALIERKARRQGPKSRAERARAACRDSDEHDEIDEFKQELQELSERLVAKTMPREAKQRAKRELRKLSMIPPMSPESTVVRNYLDWLLTLPWDTCSPDKHDIAEARSILDEDHYGLEKVKERILEYLAVRALVGTMRGPILCFVGPPGVGKTSLARSIARATGRRYVRVALGGIRDEAEIRGHRRTYVGALPGRILQRLKRAGTSNPVFLLDEIDKLSADYRGDPSSALLEVLDPEQNHTFNDHYLELDYDLSRVMFIATANTLHDIPSALSDRMEVIELAGYSEYEKLEIAKRYLVPKQLELNGLSKLELDFEAAALSSIISSYTREAGVRNLDREIASVCRKLACEVVSGKETKGSTHFRIGVAEVANFLGPERHRHNRAESGDEFGIASGMAVTATGGDLLVIEVTVMPGRGRLTVTGKLGDVMQESARAALSYIRSRADQLGLMRAFYQKVDIHIHVPEGAIPKDGPSAGITMATALASSLVQVPVKRKVAMSGEITLRGRVLSVGGIKEKILAAHRGGVATVLIPKDNEKDLRDIPAEVLDSMTILAVEHMDEVLQRALRLDQPDSFLAAIKPEREPDPLGIMAFADPCDPLPGDDDEDLEKADDYPLSPSPSERLRGR